MNPLVPETTRLEIKFVASENQYHTLLHWLHLHSAGFIVAFPDRRVNNIYFDTHNYAAFAENLSGASQRAKVRYRWYGTSSGPGPGSLEVKCKRNHFGWKLSYEIPKGPYKPQTNWRAIRREILEHLPADGKMWLDANPFPVLINRYYRKYLMSSDRKVRVTLDTKQTAWDQRFSSYPNFNRRANLPSLLVVEFKFDLKDREAASGIMQGMPLRVSRHSKYINGVRAISV